MASSILHSGGVVVLYLESEYLFLEVIYLQCTNVVKFEIMMGRKRCNIVGCYIAPNDASTIEDDVVSIVRQP